MPFKQPSNTNSCGTLHRFKYTGHKRHLIGETALGRVDKQGRFEVQVDRFSHRFSHFWWRQNPQHWDRIWPRCEACGNEIDPDLCWCGEEVEGHGWHNNHNAVPIGCTCGYDKGN